MVDHILEGGEDGLVSLLTQCTDILEVDNKKIIEVVYICIPWMLLSNFMSN